VIRAAATALSDLLLLRDLQHVPPPASSLVPARLVASVTTVVHFSAKSFVPPPKLDSAVMTIPIQPRKPAPGIVFNEWNA
jgi:16S rRNA A1518/A1519 N6-dimethyltransferase RsmA/KsgA/DIM1 with predicted DNA glycosylase/AP lyase activity